MAKGKTSQFFVWILLGLLIVGLAGFGATNFGGNLRSVGQVGETEIELDRYARELQQELRALQAQAGRAIPLAEAQQLGIPQNVLQRLVTQTALENEAAVIGLSVGDDIVSQEILSIPTFRGLDGEFDREAYRFTLEQSGLSIAEFEERIRAETSSQILTGALIGGVTTPDLFVDTLYAYAREERDITWARLSAANLPEPLGEPSEADLEAYHAANADLFTLPETKVITYAWLTTDMLLDEVEVDEAALREMYEDRIDEFVQPERRLVERLVFGTEAEAAEARAAIEAGETTFDDLVTERGLTLEDVDLGDASRGDLGEAAEAVFALTEPGVAGPAPSPLGPALYRMIAILNAQETSFEEARGELGQAIAADRAGRIIADSIVDIDDLLAGGATLEELAEETQMQLGQIDWRTDVAEGIAAYQDFRLAAAELTASDFPEVLELEDSGIFAMRLDETRPPELQPLNAVRPDVIIGWEVTETTRLLAEDARRIAADLNAGTEMAGIGLPIEVDRGLTRDAFIPSTPPDFVTRVFEMETGVIEVVEDRGQVLIVRLDEVRVPDPDAPEAQAIKAAFASETAQGLATDLLGAFATAATAQAGVTIDQTAINAVHAQFP